MFHYLFFIYFCVFLFFFFFKQKTAYEIRLSLVGSEMCIRDRYYFLLRRWWRVFRSNLRCFFFDMRLRRFLMTDPTEPTLIECLRLAEARDGRVTRCLSLQRSRPYRHPRPHWTSWRRAGQTVPRPLGAPERTCRTAPRAGRRCVPTG